MQLLTTDEVGATVFLTVAETEKYRKEVRTLFGFSLPGESVVWQLRELLLPGPVEGGE